MAARVLTEEDLEPLRRELAELRAAVEGRATGDLDTAGAAALAGVSRETVLDWIRRRGLAAYRPPGSRSHRIRRADLQAFLASPTARRPPRPGSPVDLAAEARRILHRPRR